MIRLKEFLFIPLSFNEIEVIDLTTLKCRLCNYITLREIYFCLENDYENSGVNSYTLLFSEYYVCVLYLRLSYLCQIKSVGMRGACKWHRYN